jgi:hypothetical protein
MYDEESQYGVQVLETVATRHPETFLRICASLVPRELLVSTMQQEPAYVTPEEARAEVERLLKERDERR